MGRDGERWRGMGRDGEIGGDMERDGGVALYLLISSTYSLLA